MYQILIVYRQDGDVKSMLLTSSSNIPMHIVNSFEKSFTIYNPATTWIIKAFVSTARIEEIRLT